MYLQKRLDLDDNDYKILLKTKRFPRLFLTAVAFSPFCIARRLWFDHYFGFSKAHWFN
jgi:hypothetical protein